MRRGAAAADDDYLEVPSLQGQPRSQIDPRFEFDQDDQHVPAAIDTDNTLDGQNEDLELYDTAQPEHFNHKPAPRVSKMMRKSEA